MSNARYIGVQGGMRREPEVEPGEAQRNPAGYAWDPRGHQTREAAVTEIKHWFCQRCHAWHSIAMPILDCAAPTEPAVGAQPVSNRQRGLLIADWLEQRKHITREQVYAVLDGITDLLNGQDKIDAATFGAAAPLEQTGTRDANENLADYLLRTPPPQWDYKEVLILANKVAAGQSAASLSERERLLDLAARKTALLAMELARECLLSFNLQVSEHPKAMRLRDICYTLIGTKHHAAEPNEAAALGRTQGQPAGATGERGK